MKSNFDISKGIPKTDINWSDLGRVSMIESWAKELKKIISGETKKSQWPMVGYATMILHDNEDIGIQLAQKVAKQASLNFIHLGEDQFLNILSKEAPIHQDTPTLAYVSQGDWSRAVDPKEGPVNPEIKVFRDNLPQYLKKRSYKARLILVTSGQRYDELDESLRISGCFDRRFAIPKPTLEEQGLSFIKKVGLKICDDSLTKSPGKVGKLLEIDFDNKRIQGLIALAMQRLAFRESRKLSFKDLVYFAMNGSQETETSPEINPHLLERVAIHEAGHALVAIIDSKGQNIPDYASIAGNDEINGLVSDSYDYHYTTNNQKTLANTRHKIRIFLGGRAAEEITYGKENVSSWGARSDLVSATNQAKNLIGLLGFTPNIDSIDINHENLAVADEQPSPAEDQHVVEMVRKFLSQEYLHVYQLIQDNKNLLINIKQKLLEEKLLNQSDLLGLLNQSEINL